MPSVAFYPCSNCYFCMLSDFKVKSTSVTVIYVFSSVLTDKQQVLKYGSFFAFEFLVFFGGAKKWTAVI